jgi:hypothetical protein
MPQTPLMPHKMHINHAGKLHEKVLKKAPIDGIWIGDPNDNSTWGIHFKEGATPQQIADAQAELQNYDPLPTIVEAELKRTSEKVSNFIQERYSIFHQMALSSMRLESKIKNKNQAEAYLDACWNWITSVMQVYYQKETEILAIATDPGKTKKNKEDEIEALVDAVDLSSFDASDPKVTIKSAMEKMAL